MGGNGSRETESIQASENEQGEGGAVVTRNTLDGLFGTSHSEDTTRLLMTPGDNVIPPVLMRSDLPSNRCILAMVGYYQKCVKHDYQGGKDLILMLAASLVSKGGKRANLVSDTVIGQKSSIHRNVGKGMMSKVKDWVGGGGGD